MWLNIYCITLAHLCTPVKVNRGPLPSTTAHPSCKAFSRTSTPHFGLLYSQRCRSYSPPRSRSGTAHPSSSWCREVREAAASRAWRGHPADSRMCCQERTVMSEVLPWQTLFFLLLSLIFKIFFFFFLQIWTSKTPSDLLWVDKIIFFASQQKQLLHFLLQLCSQSQLQLIAQLSLT